MESTVHWLLEVSVNEGQLDAFKELMTEMVAATKNEPDTLIYEWYFNEDHSTCQISERYRDSAATMVQGWRVVGAVAKYNTRHNPRKQ